MWPTPVRDTYNTLKTHSTAIREVVESAGVSLRRHGKELRGLCPFHKDRNPSFSVNPDKGRWYCHACAVGGDAIRFVEKFHNVSFKSALALLGLNGNARPPRQPDPAREQARSIAEWARDMSRRICDHLREIGDEIHTCSLARKLPGIDRILIARHEAALIRQWGILCNLDDDLNNPATAAELWRARDMIEALVDGLCFGAVCRSTDDVKWLKNYFQRVAPDMARKIFAELQ
jgi:hypothetical protein